MRGAKETLGRMTSVVHSDWSTRLIASSCVYEEGEGMHFKSSLNMALNSEVTVNETASAKTLSAS